MALLGVLLGITMCAVVWAIREVIEHKKLIIDLQNITIFDMSHRISALERSKPVPEVTSVAEDPKPKHIRMRAWNEDAVIPEVTK